MPNTRTYKIAPDGVVNVSGVDFGTKDGKSALRHHCDEGRYIIFKWLGHQTWAGLGRQSYFQTHMKVAEKISESEGENGVRTVIAKELLSFPVKA